MGELVERYVPKHRRCPRHDLFLTHERGCPGGPGMRGICECRRGDGSCDPHCLNPARYYEELGTT